VLRIRFGNGEVIDFYADSPADKEGWLRVMSEAVGKGASSGNGALKPWADLVLKRERSMKTSNETLLICGAIRIEVNHFTIAKADAESFLNKHVAIFFLATSEGDQHKGRFPPQICICRGRRWLHVC
jgi:hypothetical protein